MSTVVFMYFNCLTLLLHMIFQGNRMMIVKNSYQLPIWPVMPVVCYCHQLFVLLFATVLILTLYKTYFFITILLDSVDHACSSAFWKKVEPIFASLSVQDLPYFSQQVITKICHDNDALLFVCFQWTLSFFTFFYVIFWIS